jgi:hypothetical protein
METNTRKPQKVRVTLSITKQAQDTMLDNGYCSVRGMGKFISQLIMDYHASKTGTLTPTQISAEIHRLVDMLSER